MTQDNAELQSLMTELGRAARSAAAARAVPLASCGRSMFSSAVNSGSKWWNW